MNDLYILDAYLIREIEKNILLFIQDINFIEMCLIENIELYVALNNNTMIINFYFNRGI